MVKLDIEPTLLIVCKFLLLQVFPMYRRQQIIVKQYFRLLFAKVESLCLLSITCYLPTAFNIHTCTYMFLSNAKQLGSPTKGSNYTYVSGVIIFIFT